MPGFSAINLREINPIRNQEIEEALPLTCVQVAHENVMQRRRDLAFDAERRR